MTVKTKFSPIGISATGVTDLPGLLRLMMLRSNDRFKVYSPACILLIPVGHYAEESKVPAATSAPVRIIGPV